MHAYLRYELHYKRHEDGESAMLIDKAHQIHGYELTPYIAPSTELVIAPLSDCSRAKQGLSAGLDRTAEDAV